MCWGVEPLAHLQPSPSLPQESVYARLAQSGFPLKHRGVVVTGKGFPCLATRLFLYKLRRAFRVPFLCLVDAGL